MSGSERLHVRGKIESSVKEDRIDRSNPGLSFGRNGRGGDLLDSLKVETNLTSREPVAPVEDGTYVRARVGHATVEEALQFRDLDVALVHTLPVSEMIFIRSCVSSGGAMNPYAQPSSNLASAEKLTAP